MHGLDLTHSPTILELGNACSGSEVSAVHLLHDHVLKFQKDCFKETAMEDAFSVPFILSWPNLIRNYMETRALWLSNYCFPN